MTRKHAQILALARAGNPVRAWAMFGAVFGERVLGDNTDDPKVLTLKGRLQKDLADRAAGDERQRLYRDACASYLAAYELKSDSYPLINAATLALLAGDTAQSQALARQVLDLIDSDPSEGETPYWREATAAEALLLLDQRRQAKDRLAQGIEKLPRAWEDHAATIGQFERIAALRDESSEWLDAYRPPCSVHFSGLIGLDPGDPQLTSAIKQVIADLQPGFAFGALAAGADIMLAEALVGAGAQLHVILPCSADEFRSVSVEPYGEDWPARFDALLAQADTVQILSEHAGCHDGPSGFDLASLAAMGQALRQADVLQSSAHAITIAASGEGLRAPLRAWEASGLPLRTIETRRVTAPQDVSANTNAEDQQSQWTCLLSVRGAGGPKVQDLAATHGVKLLSPIEPLLLSGGGTECQGLAAELIQSSPNCAIGIHIGLGEEAPIQPALAEQVSSLAKAAANGTILCDWQSAMACKALSPAIRIEEMGELKLPAGRIGIWSLRL